MNTSNTVKAPQVDFHSKMPVISKVIMKRDFQSILKTLKDSGFTVTKLDAGYTVHNDRVLVLKAMQGSQGYLVRMFEHLFE